MLDRLNAEQTGEDEMSWRYIFSLVCEWEYSNMVDVLILMVHPDLAGVGSMASMRAEMIGWLSRDG